MNPLASHFEISNAFLQNSFLQLQKPMDNIRVREVLKLSRTDEPRSGRPIEEMCIRDSLNTHYSL